MTRHGVMWGGWTGLMLIGQLALAPARGDEPPDDVLGVDAAAIGAMHSEPLPAPVVVHGPRHEALSAPQAGAHERAKEGSAERVPKPPPTAVTERPGADPHTPGAQWVGGYWSWDKARRDYVWVTGTWHVSPAGKFWVNGYWRRDGQGWYRVPGFWSARADGSAERSPDWKTDGPPRAPDEEMVPPPGPDHFYVAGLYMPEAEGTDLVWKAGFWYPSNPGWEWIPAHWVHRSTGWVFRKGWWQRAEVPAAEPSETRAPATIVPPGYPTQTSTPRYGVGPAGAPLRGRVRARS